MTYQKLTIKGLAGMILVFGIAMTPAIAADPYLRVGLFVGQPKPGEDAEVREYLSYSPVIAPGDGKFLRLFADSNVPATFLIVAIDRTTKDLSKEWSPRIWKNQEAFSEVDFPAGARDGIPFRPDIDLDLFVVVLPDEFEGTENLARNVGQLEKLREQEDRQRRLLHAGAIRKSVEEWFQDQNKEKCVPQYRPPARAATQRSGSKVTFLWREAHLVHKFEIEKDRQPFVIRIPVTPDSGKK